MKNEIVEIHKSGNFYHTFGDDALIIHNLLGYRIVKEKGGVGFPESSLHKVINILDSKEISYKVYVKDSLVESKDFKKINKYKKVLKESHNKLEIELRFEKIEEEIKKMNIDELKEILEIIEDAISY